MSRCSGLEDTSIEDTFCDITEEIVDDTFYCECNICNQSKCTCPREYCTIDVTGIGITPHYDPKIELSVIEDILVDTIACGDEELGEIIADNVSDALFFSAGCRTNLRYLNAQLYLIDIALFFVRNRVDEFRSRSNSKGNDQYDATAKTDSQAQRTSQGTSCSFEDQESFQQFQRDSVDRYRAQSDTTARSEGTSLTTRTDRSKTAAQGYSSIADFSVAQSTGRGNGQSQTQDIASSKSYSKTFAGFGPQLNDLDPGTVEANLGENIEFEWNPVIITGTFPNLNLQFQFPQITVDGESLFDDSIDNTYDNPGVMPLPDCPPLSCRDEDYDQTSPFPSYGRGYTASYNLSLSAFGFAVRVDWSIGGSFRQQDIQSQRCSSSIGTAFTSSEYDQRDEARSEGTTDIHDESSNMRDVVTIGDSFRDAFSSTTAGSATTGDAHSESHSGSDREQHSENQASNQGTARSQSRSRTDSISISNSELKATGRKYSQIFDALFDLWKITLEELKLAQAEINASQGPGVAKIVGSNKYSLPPDPILRRNFRYTCFGHIGALRGSLSWTTVN